MILRRFSRNLAKQDWTAMVLELIIVIVGIFIAVQVDRWYESRKERAELRSLVEALRIDFEENERRLVGVIEENQRQIDAALILREQIRKDRPDISVPELNKLFSEIAALPTFEAVNRTYENLVSSGNIANILDSAAQSKIVDFYTAYELTKLIMNSQELSFVTTIQPYMIANLDYAATARREVGERRKDLAPYLDADLILESIKTKEFENIVVAEWETAHDLGRNYQTLLDRVLAIQSLINEDQRHEPVD